MPPSPTGAQAIDLSQPQRQSPLAAVFLVIKGVRAIGIVQIVLGVGFVFARSGSLVAILVGALVIGLILLAISIVSWWRYTFRVEGGELRVESGILSRNRLTVPLDRVQSVSIEQKFLHRIVGLVEVTADTAGTSGSEFNLAAVPRSVAEAVQAAAADHRAARQGADQPRQLPDGEGSGFTSASQGSAEERPERVLIKRTPRELLKIAFTTLPIYGLAVLAPLFAVGGELGDNIPVDLPDISVEPGAWLFWFVPLALLVVVTAGFALNAVTLLLREWDMTITQTAKGLRRNAGLLSKRSTASSIPRIQLMTQSQNMLERYAGITSMRLQGVSSAAEVGAVSGGGTIAADGCTDEEVALLRSIVFDGSEPVHTLDRRVSNLEVFKQTRNTAVFAALLAAGLFWSPIGVWSLLALLMIPWVWLSVRRSTRLRRWGINADAISDRHAFLGYRSTETLLRKTNSATVQQSLFERKRNLATVSLKLANGDVTIGMIPIEEAKAIRDRAIYVAETDTRAFM